MTHLDDEEEQLLQAARRAFTPQASDAARVLAATRAALVAGDAVAEMPSEGAASTLGVGTLAHRWLLRTAIGLSIAGVSGAIGYRMGLRAGEESRAADPRPSPAAAKPKTAAATQLPMTSPDVAATPRREGPEPVRPTPRTQAPRAAVRVPRDEPSTEASATAATNGASLDEEVRALREVERALRDRNPRVALTLLGELDRTVPGGQLQEERAAAFAVARCALGFGSPDIIVRDYANAHPSSLYLARVQQACPSDAEK